MKRGLNLLLVIAVLGLFASGCATAYPIGSLYTELTLPTAVGPAEATSYSKIGESTCNSYLALIATGDCSIEAAAQNGDIQKIKLVDYKAKNVLGLIGEYTTTVYGD